LTFENKGITFVDTLIEISMMFFNKIEPKNTLRVKKECAIKGIKAK